MNFYIIFYILLLILTYIAYIDDDKKCFKIAAVITFLFVGLRAPVVGADTWNYYRYFTGERNFYNWGHYYGRELELLFPLYNKVLGFIIFKQGQLYILVNTFISLGIIYFYVKKYSSFKTLSILLFFLIVSYQNYFVALRQILGISVLLVGFYFILEDKKNKWMIYLICSLIGWGLHTMTLISAVILILLYYVKIPSRMIGVTLIVATFILGRVLEYFDIQGIMHSFLLLNISATERLNNYFESAGQIEGGVSSLLIFSRSSLLAILILSLIPKNKISHVFCTIYVFGLCVTNIFGDFFLIYRVTLVFQLFVIIVFTWIFSSDNILYKQHRHGLNIILTIVILYIFQASLKTHIYYDKFADDKMHPYYFFFQDYSNHYTLKDPDYR